MLFRVKWADFLQLCNLLWKIRAYGSFKVCYMNNLWCNCTTTGSWKMGDGTVRLVRCQHSANTSNKKACEMIVFIVNMYICETFSNVHVVCMFGVTWVLKWKDCCVVLLECTPTHWNPEPTQHWSQEWDSKWCSGTFLYWRLLQMILIVPGCGLN